MFRCYDINLNLTEKILTSSDGSLALSDFKQNLKKNEQQIKKSLHDFYLSNGELDAAALQSEWFPCIETNHIFLSHSHKDKETAICLAAILKESLGIDVFIDSCVWGYADELLKEIDDKYAYCKESQVYSYEVRNRTTSNIYLILQSSLASMIDSSECLFFLNTDNTVSELRNKDKIEQRTSSPWIMSELQFSSMVQRKQSPLANRSKDFSLISKSHKLKLESAANFQISHKLPTEHLQKVKTEELFKWILQSSQEGLKGYDALTLLYETQNNG
ncbi:toll/interleukin-1 receptor domain-containing protein [Vibrio parahaemolyticus]|nr:toll/interleukin-1 receptor domain-containing protein [Vibrio parahaemolyticus]